MSSRSDREFLEDIREAIRRAHMYVDGISYEQFLIDLKTQDALIRTLEIIGEATKRLSPEIRERHSAIPWKSMAGVRDKLIHDYFGVNFDIVWQIVQDELPAVAVVVEHCSPQICNNPGRASAGIDQGKAALFHNCNGLWLHSFVFSDMYIR